MSEEDRADPQDSAERRTEAMAEHTEEILTAVREDLGNQKYPVRSEELSAQYADRPLDLPNETESLGSVFDRVEKSDFENARQAFEAIATEIGVQIRRAGKHNPSSRSGARTTVAWRG